MVKAWMQTPHQDAKELCGIERGWLREWWHRSNRPGQLGDEATCFPEVLGEHPLRECRVHRWDTILAGRGDVGWGRTSFPVLWEPEGQLGLSAGKEGQKGQTLQASSFPKAHIPPPIPPSSFLQPPPYQAGPLPRF